MVVLVLALLLLWVCQQLWRGVVLVLLRVLQVLVAAQQQLV